MLNSFRSVFRISCIRFSTFGHATLAFIVSRMIRLMLCESPTHAFESLHFSPCAPSYSSDVGIS